MIETIAYWGYIGMMEKKMEATIVYWSYIEKIEKMETTIVCRALHEGSFVLPAKRRFFLRAANSPCKRVHLEP